MSEAVRNSLVAMVAVGLLHNIIAAQRPREVEMAPATAHAAVNVAPDAVAGVERHARTNLPLDGLREMFEFATARRAPPSDCARGAGEDAPSAPPMRRTDTAFPEQIGGPNAVVNAYEDERSANGGAGDVAPFDGWGGAASLT